MHPLLGEILLGRKEVDPQTLREALAEQKPLGRILTEKHGIPSSKIEAALGEQEVRSSSPQKPAGEAASIRVRAEKLDDLMNLVGEIVTVQTQLFQTVRGHRDKHLYGMVEHLGRLSSELRNNTMSIRMVPIGTLFGRFHRIVRDLSLEMKKEAALEIEGAETELDKTVIEKLNDPLVHLLRNSLDHGIEHPKKRETAGKPAKGRIFLRARYAGAFVEIIVEDDGAGLDVKRVTEKAVRQGLIPAGTSLTDAEAFRHIFLPGFSTAERVTGISGRGVGMDVVKQAVEALGGSVHGESFSGKGTRFSLQIPLTLAIIDGFLVRSGTTVFVIPLVAVEKCRELPQIAGPAGRRILDVEGVSVPYFVLRERFEIPGDPPERQEMVVLRMPEGRIGVVVDQIIGGHQTVVKPLGDIAKAGIGISEATVLGDGSLAFILDINKL
jgi:two-component system chemotaxis sensor kinase CheA